jgi:hypothetical protein
VEKTRHYTPRLKPSFITEREQLQERSRMTKQLYAQISIDAKACIDRRMLKIAVQISRKYDIHNNILKVHKIAKQILHQTGYTG